MLNETFNISINLDDFEIVNDSKPADNFEITEEDINIKQPDAIAMKLKNRHFCRRLVSEHQLENLIDWEFEDGASYHILSQGDIDSFSYLKFILRQQKIDYLLTSTWVIAKTDIEEFENYLKIGRIKKMDFYVGEILPSSQYPRYVELANLVRKYDGRCAVFRNHSKVFVGFGSKFNFVIETSANVTTNPRCENTTITLNTELALFYKEFYDGIKSFNRDFDDWKPTIIGEKL